MSKFIMKTVQIGAITLALVAATIPLETRAQTPASSANVFGRCAVQKDADLKLAACKEAASATSYVWILRWVYRELARAHRERGETDSAILSYTRSLAAHEDDTVRREMESLLTQ